MKKIKVLLLLSAVLILGVTSCSKKEELTIGEVKDGKYTNEFFGMELTVLDEWTVYTQDELYEIMQTGNDIANELTEKDTDLDKLNYLCLFGAYNPETEATIIITAEKPALLASAVTTIDKYLDISKEPLEAMGYEISSYSKKKIGNKEFSYFIASLPLYSDEYKMYLYSIKDDGYFVSINYYSAFAEELEEIETVIENMKYK